MKKCRRGGYKQSMTSKFEIHWNIKLICSDEWWMFLAGGGAYQYKKSKESTHDKHLKVIALFDKHQIYTYCNSSIGTLTPPFPYWIRLRGTFNCFLQNTFSPDNILSTYFPQGHTSLISFSSDSRQKILGWAGDLLILKLKNCNLKI